MSVVESNAKDIERNKRRLRVLARSNENKQVVGDVALLAKEFHTEAVPMTHSLFPQDNMDLTNLKDVIPNINDLLKNMDLKPSLCPKNSPKHKSQATSSTFNYSLAWNYIMIIGVIIMSIINYRIKSYDINILLICIMTSPMVHYIFTSLEENFIVKLIKLNGVILKIFNFLMILKMVANDLSICCFTMIITHSLCMYFNNDSI